MIAIVDCNSFYCSCERVFRPALVKKPVVVLSNNDGCIIARSDEAKALGVGMAGPYFLEKPLIEKHNVAVFSSNYNLYGDMSWRVMETLRTLVGKENVEVYSVDESFLDLSFAKDKDLNEIAMNIRQTVEMWTGVAVSVGVAPTKVLAKLANRLSKKNKEATNCVLVLDTPNKIEQALKRTKIGDVWGVGHQYAQKLVAAGIENAYDLSQKDLPWAQKNLGGVVGVRLVRELQGQSSIMMEEELTQKKMIATTRMFGSPVKDIKDIKEAVATYISRAAEKLRRQHCVASVISVFVVPKEAPREDARFRHGPSVSGYATLPIATSLTNELLKPAMELVEQLYKNGELYKKAGVTLSGIVPESSVQTNMFLDDSKRPDGTLMTAIDNVNFSMRDDMLKFAASGTERNWKMQQNHHSPRYTSRWDEMFEVK